MVKSDLMTYVMNGNEWFRYHKCVPGPLVTTLLVPIQGGKECARTLSLLYIYRGKRVRENEAL